MNKHGKLCKNHSYCGIKMSEKFKFVSNDDTNDYEHITGNLLIFI